LAPEQALNYGELRDALLKRFDFTEEGFRKRFRNNRVENSETVSQFAMRLTSYFTGLLDLSKCPKTYEGLRDLILRQQVLFCFNTERFMFLRERTPANLLRQVLFFKI